MAVSQELSTGSGAFFMGKCSGSVRICCSTRVEAALKTKLMLVIAFDSRVLAQFHTDALNYVPFREEDFQRHCR